MKSALLLAIACLALAAACYDPKSPNLPPCSDDATWPDPCSGKARDAGKDG